MRKIFFHFCVLLFTCSFHTLAANELLSSPFENVKYLRSGSEISLSEEVFAFQNGMKFLKEYSLCMSQSKQLKLKNGINDIGTIISALFLNSKWEVPKGLASLKEMTEEECLDCRKVLFKVKEVAESILNGIAEIDEEVKESKVYDSVVTVVHSLLALASDVCDEISPFGELFVEEFSRIGVDEHFEGELNIFWPYLAKDEDQSCLTSAQKGDLEEIIQLAGNVLNTFSQWLKESEDKVQTDELKYVLNKLSQLLATERDMLEEHGEEVVEKSCEVCAVVSKYSLKLLKTVEKLMNVFFPIWRYIPFTDKLANDVEALLSKMQDTCKYDSLVLQVFDFQETCWNEEQAKEFSKLYSTMIQVATLVQKEVPEATVLLPFEENNVVCFSCRSILEKVENFVTKVKSELDEFLPNWRSFPFAETIINLIDEILGQIAHMCKDYRITKLSSIVTEFEVKDTEKDILFSDLRQLLTNTDFVLESLVPSENDFVLIKFQQFFKRWASEVNEEGLIGNICSFVITEGEAMLSEVKALLEEHFPKWRTTKGVSMLIDFVESVLDKIKEICPNEHKQLLRSKDLLNPTSLTSEMKSICSETEVKRVLEDFAFLLLKITSEEPKVFEKFSKFVFTEVLHSQRFKCDEAVDFVESIVHQLEDILSDVIPNWRELPILPQIDSALHKVIKNLHNLCPEFVVLPRSSCLTEKDEEIVSQALEEVDTVFDKLINVVEDVKDQLPFPKLEEVFDSVQDKLKRADRWLDNQLKQTAEVLCDNCEVIVDHIDHTVKEVVKILDEKFEDWKEVKVLNDVVKDVQQFLENVEEYCPAKKGLVMKREDGCLTLYEKEKFSNITAQVKVGLDIVARVIELRAEFEEDPVKKYSLKTAAKVVKVVGTDVVLNLTRLADEFCGDCEQLTQAVEDTFLVLENALFDVEPLWKRTPIYAGIQEITEKVFDEVKSICNDNYKTVTAAKNCLTPEQKTNMDYYVSGADTLLTYIANTLKTYADDLPEGETKEELEQVSTFLLSVDKDLVRNFTRIADESCGSCLDIVKALKDFENVVESFMSDISPDWRSDGEYSAVAAAVDTFIGLLEGICPTTITSVVCQLEKASSFKVTSALKSLQKSLIESVVQEDVLLVREALKSFVLELMREFGEGEKSRAVAVVERQMRKSVEFSCESVVEGVSDALVELKEFIDSIVPNAKENPIANLLFDAIESVLRFLDNLCPDEVKYSQMKFVGENFDAVEV